MTYELLEITWVKHEPGVTFSVPYIEKMTQEHHDQLFVDAETMRPLKGKDFYETFPYNDTVLARLTKPIVVFWFSVASNDYSGLGETIDAVGIEDEVLSDPKFVEIFQSEKYSGGKSNRVVLAYEITTYGYKYGDGEDDYEYEYHPELLGTLDLTVKPALEYEVKHNEDSL